MHIRGGHWGSRFCGFGPFLPRFFGVIDFEARFRGFIQHRGLQYTLHTAQERYTDIAVSVFNNFENGFAVFGAFCCGFSAFATPQCPPDIRLTVRHTTFNVIN